MSKKEKQNVEATASRFAKPGTVNPPTVPGLNTPSPPLSLENPPIPYPIGQRGRSELEDQKLRTPSIEEGVEIEPATEGANRISRRILRAWSTLWGWTGSCLKRVRVDRHGYLMTRQPAWDLTTHYTGNQVIASGVSHAFDCGQQLDHHTLWGWSDVFNVEFSTDGVTYGCKRFAPTTQPAVGSPMGWYEIFCTCRYVKVTNIGPNNLTVYLYSDKLKE